MPPANALELAIRARALFCWARSAGHDGEAAGFATQALSEPSRGVAAVVDWGLQRGVLGGFRELNIDRRVLPYRSRDSSGGRIEPEVTLEPAGVDVEERRCGRD